MDGKGQHVTAAVIAGLVGVVGFFELAKTVGGWRSRFYGGTVVLLDANRKLTVQVDGMELENRRTLIKKL